ncbi:MAG: S8 family serine peptidase [Kiloniellales bacterium]
MTNDRMAANGHKGWTQAQNTSGYDTYDCWYQINGAAEAQSADTVDSADTAGTAAKNDQFLRIFVRLTPEKGARRDPSKNSLLDIIDVLEKNDGVRFDTTEARNFERLRRRPKDGANRASRKWDRRVVLLMKRSALDELAHQGLFEVLHIGPPLAIPKQRPNKHKGRADTDQNAEADKEPGPRVLVGVVEDSIPFLNRRFQTARHKTRFRRVWLQSSQVLGFDDEERQDRIDQVDDADIEGDQPKGNRHDPNVGRILSRKAINRMIKHVKDAEKNGASEKSGARGQSQPQANPKPDLVPRSEAQIYKRRADKVARPGERRQSALAWSHGAQVADLACGAEPGEMDDVKILGVQLPSHAVRDTSGRELGAYVIQATRWIIDQAIAINNAPRNQDHTVPLIINLSLGVLAGPKDGSGFVEDWLEQEIERFAENSGNAPIRIVLAYGNAYRNRQVAVHEIEAGQRAHLHWRIQPQDRTDSFIEVRAKQADCLEWSLQPPCHAHEFVALPEAGQHHELDLGQGTVAAVVRDKNDTESDASLLFAMRPTASLEPGPLAPSGAWSLAFENKGDKTIVVTMQIQRDDTPRGYRETGRQSYFENSQVGSYDDELKEYVGLGESPITGEGTHSSYAGLAARNPNVYSVGAARCSVSRSFLGEHGNADHPPAYYSAAGTDKKALSRSSGPDLSAFGDEGRFLPGVRAHGLLTGSNARLSGTSAAAPQVTRRLAMLDALLPLSSTGSQTDEDTRAEIDALLGPAAASIQPKWKARLGKGIVPPSSCNPL